MTGDKAAELRVRAMQLDDVESVHAQEIRNYEHPWTPGIIKDCIKTGYECMQLLLEDRLIGYYVLQVAANEAHLLNICIDKPLQNKGYALQLLRIAIKSAVKLQATELFLEVRPSNRRAIKLYEGMGFNEIGLRPNYYDASHGREDAIVMALNLQVHKDG